MNAMIRVVKGTLALLALAGVGLLLRWITAGSISGLRTYDLDSLTVLVVGTIAWIAYGWLVLAVLLTVLEQVPGAIGTLSGAVAGRITTKTAQTLLRSGLGVAAVTPLTLTAAQATPDTTHVREWPQSTTPQLHLTATDTSSSQPHSKAQHGETNTSYRTTEPRSTVELGATEPQTEARLGRPDTSYRATEPHSTVELGATDSSAAATEPRTQAQPSQTGKSYRATEPASSVEIGGATTDQAAHDFRATEPASTVQIGPDAHSTSTDNTAANQHGDDYRATEPRSTVEIGNSNQPDPDYRATEPPSKLHLGSTPTPTDKPTPNRPSDPTGTRTPGPTKPPTTTPATTKPGTIKPGSTKPGPATPDTTSAGRTTTGSPTPDRSRTSDRPAIPGDATTPKPEQTDKSAARARVGVPDRPVDGAPTRYTELRPTVPVRVVVREGDSLWKIAARELGPSATAEAIAARWPDWYAANRHVIGNDPDLILPGQVLRIPPAPTGDHLPPHHQEQ